MTLCDPEFDREGMAEAGQAGLALPDGVPPLVSFYLYLTSSCNLRCRHCWIAPSYVEGAPRPGEYLELDLLKKAVAEAKPLGLCSAKLTGGEPVLHPQFVQVVDYLTDQGLSLSMETNGTLVDAALARHLKEKTTLASVSLSIDGPGPDVHDPFRGVVGSFEMAVRGFRHLVAAGYRPQLIMCPHRGNVEHVDEVVKLAVELGAGSVKFNPVTNSGRGTAMHERGEALSLEEILALARFVRGDLQRRTPIRLIMSTPPAFYTVSELVRGGLDGRCHVRHILGILGTGEMALCGIGYTIPDLSFGRLGEASVADVWCRHPVLCGLRRDLDAEYSGICGECIHARGCLTYCVAENYQVAKRLVSPHWLCFQADRLGIFPVSRRNETNGG